jgi:hypothetical protein
MKYRKKPVVIDAIQVENFTNWNELCEFAGETKLIGVYVNPDRPSHWEGAPVWDPQVMGAIIPTLEGTMLANVGDWLVRGVQGELYPVKPEIFQTTYEAVVTSGGESV